MDLNLGTLSGLVHWEGMLWAADNNEVLVVSTKTGEQHYLSRGHTRKIRAMGLVGGDEVWTCGADGKVCMWNTAARSVAASNSAHGTPVCSLLEVGDFVWTGGSEASIIIWDAVERCPLQELEGYHLEGLVSMVLTGSSIWSVSKDGTICVWRWKGR